jgi:REP element-mobilizing transposase RayT
MTCPERKKLRLTNIKYDTGMYFVTVCTKDKIKCFGHVENGSIILSELGNFLDKNISDIHSHYSDIIIPYWVVMPNHFHALIIIGDECSGIGGRLQCNDTRNSTLIGDRRDRLSVVVAGIKSAVKRFSTDNNIQFSWQPRFHDHIIRGNGELHNIVGNIMNNPYRWMDDCMYVK